ncbi:MAG: type II toxin-antitoxin system Phd/YefM family antitoxin [Bacilli bacterium]|nr:type II toxin-antitoxin system Phd/YefM family antitoxin [Bacilli bacterium]
MLAVNYSTIRNSLKNYCDKAISGETIIVTRKNEQNVVVMSLEQYNEMQRIINNAKYLAMLQKSLNELKRGDVVKKTIKELK